MTTSTDLLNGEESLFGFVLRHREFIIIAVLIIAVILILIKKGGKK